MGFILHLLWSLGSLTGTSLVAQATEVPDPAACEAVFLDEIQGLRVRLARRADLITNLKNSHWMVEPESRRILGLRDETLRSEVPQLRASLESWNQRFQTRMRYSETFRQVAQIARMQEQHLLLLGMPGGGKTRVSDFFVGEEGFRLLLTPMMEPDRILGAQDFEAARRGQIVTRITDSVISHDVALLDEVGNANAATLAALNNVLGVERELRMGNQVFPSLLQTLFAASNESLHELIERFRLERNHKAGLALTNRFLFKTYFLNWLPATEQAVLDQERDTADELYAPSDESRSVNSATDDLDFVKLRVLAEGLIRISPEYRHAEREFLNRFRRAMQELEHEFRSRRGRATTPKVATADLTERLRGSLAGVVRASAFLDLLSKPSAWAQIRSGEPLVLEPLSLWRNVYALTTTTSGEIRFVADPRSKIGYSFHFPEIPRQSLESEEESMEWIRAEQQVFVRTLEETLLSIQSAASAVAHATARLPNAVMSSATRRTGVERLLR